MADKKAQFVVRFTQGEINALGSHPEALRIVADFNDYQAAMAESIGAIESEYYHEKRAHNLREIARTLEESY